MELLALMAALCLEKIGPSRWSGLFNRLYSRLACTLERHFNGGQQHHGVIAWSLAVLPLCSFVGLVYFLLKPHPWLAFSWNVGVLYSLLSFRQFSAALSRIADALRREDLEQARTELAGWTLRAADQLSAQQVSKAAIEQGLIDTHRCLLGAVFWFLVLPGPIGVVLYRLSACLFEHWNPQAPTLQLFNKPAPFGWFVRWLYKVLDAVPIRLTAMSFAVVGDFEDALYCWRSQQSVWSAYPYGMLLASGAGALGVRLGEQALQLPMLDTAPEIGIEEEAGPEDLNSAVGLIWRAIILWFIVIAAGSIAYWI